MTTLPAPLVPADVDLRDYPAMLLDVVRLRDSELAGHPDGNIFRDNVLSWCVAWHQQPAGSLPDDDASLAKLLGYGRDIKGWARARAKGSLRGWIKCSDGRLYHPVVAEKANEAWRSKLRQQWLKECARVRKHNQRHKLNLSVPDFDDWLSLGCPQGHTLHVPVTSAQCHEGQAPPVHKDNATVSHVKHAPIEGNRREEKGILKTIPIAHATTESTGVATTTGGDACARLRQAGMADCNPQHPRLLALIAAGVTADEIAEAGREALGKGKGFPWALGMIEGRRRDAASAPPVPGGTSPPRRQTLTESRAATIAGLTGATNPKEPRNERDITAESQRLSAS